ncbi:hypothetical protein BD310DRAFT_851493, partial [Dichomitus squalens]
MTTRPHPKNKVVWLARKSNVPSGITSDIAHPICERKSSPPPGVLCVVEETWCSPVPVAMFEHIICLGLKLRTTQALGRLHHSLTFH